MTFRLVCVIVFFGGVGILGFCLGEGFGFWFEFVF